MLRLRVILLSLASVITGCIEGPAGVDVGDRTQH
jgi:hypothetical protein